MLWFTCLVAAVAVERLAELIVATRNLAWSRARGGIEYGARHYLPMVLLHTALLVGCVVEVWARRPEFIAALGWTMVGFVLLAQALRWWCINTLGYQWNTRIIVVPGGTRVRAGPYRIFAHPNYVAVVVEGIALPLVYSAWITAVVFTILNAFLLHVRIHAEEAALESTLA